MKDKQGLTVVSVPLLRSVLAVFLPLGTPHYPDRFPLPPVIPGVSPGLVIKRSLAVPGDGSVALGECLVETLLCGSLVPAEVAAPGFSVEEGVSIVLVILVTSGQDDDLTSLLCLASNELPPRRPGSRTFPPRYPGWVRSDSWVLLYTPWSGPGRRNIWLFHR